MGIVIVVIALALALNSGGKAFGKSYRSRVADWAKRNPNAGPGRSRAAAAGQMLAMLRFGPPAFLRGAAEGWPAGWQAGKEWAGRAAAQQKTAAAQPAGTTTPPAPAAAPAKSAPKPAPATPAAAKPAPATPKPDTPTTPPPPARPRAARPTAPQTRGATVARIDTATGGTVHNAEMNHSEAVTVVATYTAEHQEASGRTARMEQRVTLVEQWAAILGRSAAPAERVAEVRALIDPSTARMAAARDTLAAAHTGAAVARDVAAAAAEDAQWMGKRVGPWYGNAATAS